VITIRKRTERGLETLAELAPGSWVDVLDPSTDEVLYLQRELGIPQDFLTNPLDTDEQARTEKEDDALLIVLRVPAYQGENVDVPYVTTPLGIILTDRGVMTVSKSESCVTEELVGGRIKGLSTVKRNRFVLHLMQSTAKKYLSYLRDINRVTEGLEDKLQLSLRNKELMELLKYQKSLVYFTTALKSNELMMHRLQRSQLFRKYPDDEDFLEDVLTDIQQAIEMTNISSNILSQMMDAYASIISNNLNVVMKFLASITIVLSLPIMVASFYGMNIRLPFQENPLAFLIVMGISFGVSAGTLFFFWKKDWL
jgi:magnesium transporter